MAVREKPPTQRPGFEYVGLSARSAAMLVAAVIVARLLQGAFVDAHRPLGWVVACTVVALLLEPLVSAADRVLPHVVAVIAVLVVLGGVIGIIGFGVAHEVTDSLDELVERAPEAAAEIESTSSWAVDLELTDRVTTFTQNVDERIRGNALEQAADTAPTYLVTGILMLFLLGTGRKYVNGFTAQFAEPRRPRLRTILHRATVDGRRWMLWSIAVGLGVGIIVGATAWVLGVPAAVSLGVVAAALAVVPFVGTILGGLPAVLLAYGLEGRWVGTAVLVAVVGLQVLDAVVVRRWIERRSVRVGATVPILLGLVGYELYGGGGAVYAVALGVLALAALAAVGQDDDIVVPDCATADAAV